MKYSQEQLATMAHQVLIAKRDNDPRYKAFMLVMVARTLRSPAEIDAWLLETTNGGE